MKVKRSSLFIKTEGPDESAIIKGLAWLVGLGNNDVSKRSALLAVPIKRNLDGVISSTIGEAVTKSLAKGEKVSIKSSTLSLLTERLSVYSWAGPVLAIYPTKRLLDKIDGLIGVTDVLVIPWALVSVQYWIDTWAALELGVDTQSRHSKRFSNPVVEVALEALTSRVNLSTGISHPLDRSAAIALFKILRDAGISYNPDEIRGWLVSQGGWHPKGADSVKRVAADVLARKKLKGGQGGWKKNILAIWEERAKKK